MEFYWLLVTLIQSWSWSFNKILKKLKKLEAKFCTQNCKFTIEINVYRRGEILYMYIWYVYQTYLQGYEIWHPLRWQFIETCRSEKLTIEYGRLRIFNCLQRRYKLSDQALDKRKNLLLLYMWMKTKFRNRIAFCIISVKVCIWQYFCYSSL